MLLWRWWIEKSSVPIFLAFCYNIPFPYHLASETLTNTLSSLNTLFSFSSILVSIHIHYSYAASQALILLKQLFPCFIPFFTWPCVSHAFKKPICLVTSKQCYHTVTLFPSFEAHLPDNHHLSASIHQYLRWEVTEPSSLFSSKSSTLIYFSQVLQIPTSNPPSLQLSKTFSHIAEPNLISYSMYLRDSGTMSTF